MAPKTEVTTAAASKGSAQVANDLPGDRGAEDNNSRNADDVSLVQHEKTVAPTRFQKIKAHLWRFRWWYLLGLIIFLAILLPIL